jgi:tripartite ATP-independent transporter DctM subunit
MSIVQSLSKVPRSGGLAGGSPARRLAWVRQAEAMLAGGALAAMSMLPVLELLLRSLLGTGIPGASGYVAHLTLWVGFLGAMIATSRNRHLDLSTGAIALPPGLARIAAVVRAAVSAAVASGLAWASLEFVRADMAAPVHIGNWLPVWQAESVLCVAFAVIAARFALQPAGIGGRIATMLGIGLAVLIGFGLDAHAGVLVWPVVAALIAAALIGAPIFVVLGGVALMLFFADGVPVAAVPVEAYRIIVSPAIPAIPLFTLTGFLLAESQASTRLVRLFRALFGWLPGGLAVVTILVCAFFSTFTGASGVTILAIGGLLLPVLVRSGYAERFSIGLLTATGSIGLLFPPSLAVILYCVVAKLPIPDLFQSALLSGLLMVAAVCIFGLREGLRAKVDRPKFDPREAAAAIWETKWELLVPVVALVGMFAGRTTLIEAAAVTAAYTLFAETCLHRDLHPTRDLPRVLVDCATLIGGVFVILSVAMGLTSYLVDAEVPRHAAAWVQDHVGSRFLFLLMLNVFLLIVGCLMDIYSAIIVVVPLILPMSALYGVHPLQLGVIFLVNLELGYLTPPIGMNLFLASYRFGRPIVEICRSALPFLVVLLAVVLLITYVPALTLAPDGEAP